MKVKQWSPQMRLRLLQAVVGTIGLTMSVVLHELFHIFVHWGEIASVDLFPSRHAIVEIVLSSPREFNLLVEEAIAYSITLLVLLMTVVLVNKLQDRASEKSFSQLFFPGESDPRGLVEFAYTSQLLR